MEGHLAIVEYLKEAGADMDHQDKVWECVN